MDTSNSNSWDLSVLYQDIGFEPMDTEAVEPGTGPEVSARLWQHHAPRPPHLLTPHNVDAGLDSAGPPARLPNVASAVPPVHHAARHHELHTTIRRGTHNRRLRAADAVKRLLDIVGAMTLAVLLSPLLLVVGLILARDRGPIIYSHSRTGRHGRSFGCLKFRTMVPNADQVLCDLLTQDPKLQLEWHRDHKLRNDPRVTKIGRFLRRTSLDELPQLWNVIRGDMSLVGPRPVVREEWQRYGRHLNTYLAAKPGVTGLWQVMGRSDSRYRRRVALDRYYVRKRNFLMDCYILVRTVKVVFRGRGAW